MATHQSMHSKLASLNPERLVQEETERLRKLYKFLLDITDLGLTSGRSLSTTQVGKADRPNESLVAKQWGMSKYRIFIRRVLRSIYPNLYLEEKDYHAYPEALPQLDLYRLVSILTHLGEDKQNKVISQSIQQPCDRIVVPSGGNFHLDKLKALRLFSELSRYERELLNIPWRRGEGLLQQIIKETVTPSQNLSENSLRQVYQSFIQASQELLDPPGKGELLDPFSNDFIRAQVYQVLKNYPEFSGNPDSSVVQEFQDKVEREINRIRLQSGLQYLQQSPLTSLESSKSKRQLIQHIPSTLIPRLIKSVIENEILTEQFPIFVRYLEVKKVSPLPLYIYAENEPEGLLNKDFDLNEMDAGIERQFSHSVRIYFYARVPKKLDRISGDSSEYERIEFYEEITGIGSPLSHVTAAMNRTLLWDLPCLDEKKIFPIAKQLFLSDEIIGDSHNSPVWSHCVIQLCQTDYIQGAIDEGKSYDQVDIYAEPAHGDFCGFDMLEAIAKSALNARLRGIQQLGINPQEYLSQLGQRVREVKALRKAKQALKFYPFSIRAMEGILEAELFRAHGYGSCLLDWNSSSDMIGKVPLRSMSRVACDARLCLAESLLTEGKHEAAKKHLNALVPIMDNKGSNVSDLMRAKYHLLFAQYHYHYDISPERPMIERAVYHSDRTFAVQAAERHLSKAKEFLQNRVVTCEVLDELPQSNIHPFSSLLARIYFLEARLKLTFGAYLRYDPLIDKLHAVMICLQKARICAAQDGSSDDYSNYSAFQSWIHLLLAHIDPEHKQENINWAKRLLNHAMECYAPTGELAYHDLKNHAGVISEEMELNFCHQFGGTGCEAFGHVHVQSVPFLLEKLNRNEKNFFREAQAQDSYPILELNLHVFKEKVQSAIHQKVYLFGTHASLLLMVSGLLHLTEPKDNLDLKMTINKLLAAYATSKDGGHASRDGEFLVLKRSFEAFGFDDNQVSMIQGLYPHRISFVVALSGIFLVICSLLSIMEDYSDYYSEKLSWQEFRIRHQSDFDCITSVLTDMHEENDASQSATLKGTPLQTRFNGHLEVHFSRIKAYVENTLNALECRDTRLSTIFREKSKDKKSPSSRQFLLKMRDYVLKDTAQLILGISDIVFIQSIEQDKPGI